MNEQIKQLMEQAKYEEAVFGGGFGGPNMVKRLDPVKFAELIVGLCARQCNPEPGLKYSPNSLSARIDCKNKILELL